ncbi:O-antigen ligase [Rhodobacter aestuarii]|uniref:O-antigen ligase n=1 Tax=Rhodobacter aestuarii TaxID=453582 RepID=A0A1N7MT08_9RHOB|nr:O-antigen ligase family protein [Rhodobacter aestuarii]PTV96555.1 O-antigen ligase [Rhodobacter aestuarii]SIS89236.1 O-antigen ligase [Rhodobacter aestuarii]
MTPISQKGRAKARLSDGLAFAVAVAGLFYMTGSLVVTLTPSGASSSGKVQALGAAFGLWSMIGLWARPGALNRIVMLYWPALLAPGLAVASLLWTVDPALSLRRAGALMLTTAFALWLVERFPARVLWQILATALAVTVLASLATVFLRPQIGIHQAYDALGEQAAHAGDWRGLYFHKNDFGRMMAYCFMLSCVLLVARPRWRWSMGPVAILALLGVAGSTSGQAAFLSVLMPGLLLFGLALRRASARGRAMLVVIAVPVTLFFALVWQVLFATVLELLGKDPTLTGRTEIWGGVLAALRGNLALGGGFGAGWDIVGDKLFALTAISVGHAHNGFLDLMTDLGVVGLGLLLGLMGWLLLVGLRDFFGAKDPMLGLLAVAVSLFALVGNWAASFLLLHNSLYWVLPVVLIAHLRRRYCPWGHVVQPVAPFSRSSMSLLVPHMPRSPKAGRFPPLAP